MAKAGILALVLFGILIFLVGLVTNVWVLVLGMLMIGGGLYLGLRPGGILRKEQVLDSWGILIEDGRGRSDEVFRDVENFIRESKAPAVEMERKEIRRNATLT